MTAPKPASIPYHDEVSPLVTLADLEQPASITDREPSGWDCDGAEIHMASTSAPVVQESDCTPAMHADDTPLWLVSNADLAARDEAVRGEVLAEVRGAVDTIRGFWSPAKDGTRAVRAVRETCEAIVVLLERTEATPHADDTEAGS